MAWNRKWTVLVVVLVVLLVPVAALAGGWSVITVDSLPSDVHAGESVDLSFMIRAHGHAPIDGATPTVLAVNEESGERIRADAVPGAKTGQYVATLVFPADGVWEWEIRGGDLGPNLALAPLTVLPAAPAAAEAPAPEAATDMATAETVRMVLRGSALVLFGLAAVLIVLDRRRPQVAVAPPAGVEGTS